MTPKNLSALSTISLLKVVAINWVDADDACCNTWQVSCQSQQCNTMLPTSTHLLLDDGRDCAPELDVEGGVHLVKQVEGGGVALLQREHQAQRHHGLLPARQLRHALHHTVAWRIRN